MIEPFPPSREGWSLRVLLREIDTTRVPALTTESIAPRKRVTRTVRRLPGIGRRLRRLHDCEVYTIALLARREIARMPLPQRRVAVGRLLEHRPLGTVATLLGLELEVARRLWRRGARRLRRRLRRAGTG
jgi:DNA-directed RNA polymerase specialized sigma24 family protein